MSSFFRADSSERLIPVAKPVSNSALSRIPMIPSWKCIFRIWSIVIGCFLLIRTCSGLCSSINRFRPFRCSRTCSELEGLSSSLKRCIWSMAQRAESSPAVLKRSPIAKHLLQTTDFGLNPCFQSLLNQVIPNRIDDELSYP